MNFIRNKLYRYYTPEAPISATDVYLTTGTHGAIMATMQVLLNSGDNILIPRPGFPLIETSADNLGAETRYYDLIVKLRFQLTNHS
jgi:tyrosine aminotransferase